MKLNRIQRLKVSRMTISVKMACTHLVPITLFPSLILRVSGREPGEVPTAASTTPTPSLDLNLWCFLCLLFLCFFLGLPSLPPEPRWARKTCLYGLSEICDHQTLPQSQLLPSSSLALVDLSRFFPISFPL